MGDNKDVKSDDKGPATVAYTCLCGNHELVITPNMILCQKCKRMYHFAETPSEVSIKYPGGMLMPKPMTFNIMIRAEGQNIIAEEDSEMLIRARASGQCKSLSRNNKKDEGLN